MSRFDEAELFCAIFCRQAGTRAIVRSSKQNPHRCQRLPQNRITRRFTDIRLTQADVLRFGFYCPASVPHHRGAEEAENLANRIRERDCAVTSEKQADK